jgi:DNA-binding transcriptional MerR regulator
MAKELQQLDLFGNFQSESQLLNKSKRTNAHTGAKAKTTQKRGRKSFASMEGGMEKLKVPTKEELATKLYYPIGVVAEWFNVNTSLIRYWEKQFKQLQPRKTRKGDRLFRAEDIEILKQIYFLLREKKYSIDGAKSYLKNNEKKAEKDLALLNSLKDIKEFLVSLKDNL